MKKILLCMLFVHSFLYQQAFSQCYGETCCATEQHNPNGEDESDGDRNMNCSKNSSIWNDYYKYQQSYIPSSNLQATKTIHINIVVFGNDNGEEFPYTPSEWAANYQNYHSWINEVHQYTQSATCAAINPGYLPDSKIRFKINEMYFYNKSSILYNSTSSQVQQAVDYHLTQNPQAINQINCYLIRDFFIPGAAGMVTNVTFQGQTMPIVISGSGYNYYPAPWQGGYGYIAPHLSHELGHLLGLNHTYNSETLNQSNIDFLDDVFGNPPTHFTNCNNIMGGGQDCKFISPKQMGRCHRSLSTDVNNLGFNKIRNYAAGYSTTPIVISSDETWDFTYKSYNDIVVKKGATLTLTCRLEMVPQASIIVERGGKLIVDGATITSARCGGPEYEGVWQGIQVWGDQTKHQSATDIDGDSYHGKVIVKNDALIENARVAIQAWRPNTWDHGGGIVQIDESTLRNNWKAVHFGSYTYANSLSYAKNSVFETTQDMIDGSTPISFIEGWSIRGIRVYSNIFRNTNPNATSVSQLGKGIYLESAKAIISGLTTGVVTDYCDENNSNWQPNVFENLHKAIELVNFGMQQTNGIYTSIVNRNVFKNCIFGVESKGMPAVRIEQNRVILGGNPIYHQYNEAISQRSYTGFSITENCIEQISQNATHTGGIIVSDVSGDNNEVYRNYSFDNEHAYLSNGKNRTSSPLPDMRFRGLQFLCNQNNGTQKYDIAVEAANPNDPMSGIRYYQGGNGTALQPKSAANLFTNTCVTSESDIFNNTINPIVYFHTPAPQETPVCLSWNVSNPTLNVSNNQCPSKLTGVITGVTGVSDPVAYKNMLIAEYAIRNSQYEAASIIYNNLLDNGNTQSLMQSITSAWPSDKVNLRNTLLNNSPNLSHKLVRELASEEQSVLDNDDLLSIISANPDVAHNEELLKKLFEKANPMSAWMIEFLRNIGTYTTNRTEIEKLYAQKQYERDDIAWQIVRFILSDTTTETYSQTELHEWLNIIATPRAKYMIADDYATMGNFTEAKNVLNSIEIKDLDRYEITELEALKSWLNLQENLHVSNRNIYQLDNAEVELLRLIAGKIEQNGLAGVFAANVLNFYDQGKFELAHIYPNTTKSAQNNKEPRVLKTLSNDTDDIEMLLYPNPVKDQVTLFFENADDTHLIMIYDMKGALQYTQNRMEGSYTTLSTSKFANGTYIVQIQNKDGNIIKSEKMIVQH